MEKIYLSVIMPALNEEKNVRDAINEVLAGFKQFGIIGEIIVVNDGSTDETGAVAARCAAEHPEVRVITHDKPQGIGAAFWEGVDIADGEFVIILPGDNENDPNEIFRYIGLLEHVDMVIPFVFNKEKRSLFRNGLSFVYRFIINTTFLVYFNYTNGTVLYRKSILKELPYRNKGFFFQTDILIRTVKSGYLFAEVPYKLGQRKLGKSTAVTFPSFIQVVKGYLRLVKDYHFSDSGRTTKEEFSPRSLTKKRYSKEADKERPA